MQANFEKLRSGRLLYRNAFTRIKADGFVVNGPSSALLPQASRPKSSTPSTRYNAVKHSIQWCEARMRSSEVLAGRAMRLKLRTIAALAEQYVAELGKLMSDDNPLVRLKALERLARIRAAQERAFQPEKPVLELPSATESEQS